MSHTKKGACCVDEEFDKRQRTDVMIRNLAWEEATKGEEQVVAQARKGNMDKISDTEATTIAAIDIPTIPNSF